MAEKKILYVDPVGTTGRLEKMFQEYLNAHAGAGTRVDCASLGQAPTDLEYRYYIALVGQELLKVLKQAENDGYDAAIIGCFCDPWVHTAREICDRMPVIGVCEAALKLASSLGRTFSIVIANNKSRMVMRDNIYRMGYQDQLASFRSMDLLVDDLVVDPAETERRIEAAVDVALREDLAEVVVLGCTLQLGHYKQLQEKYGVPVIDVALAGLKYAEFLADAHQSCGWTTSARVGGDYEAPPPARMKAWGLEKHYGIEGLFD